MLARKLLMVSIGGAFVIPSFTGSYSLFGDAKKGYIELYSSGTLTFDGDSTVDVFLIGGGKKGSQGFMNSYGGDGGAGSAGQSYYEIPVSGAFNISIGSGDGNTTAFGHTQTSGGGAAGGAGATSRTVGTNGSTGVAIPFGGDSSEFTTTFGGGGGGGGLYASGSKARGIGGVKGGGGGGPANSSQAYSGVKGTANTGGGGGGGGANANSFPGGGAGGSGLVIVRWGY